MTCAFFRLADLVTDVLGFDQPFLEGLAQAFLERRVFVCELQDFLQLAKRIGRLKCRVRDLAQALAGLAWCRHEFNNALCQLVRRVFVGAAARENGRSAASTIPSGLAG